MEKKAKPCVVRLPLLYGSRACPNDATEYSDLCRRCQTLIAPMQLIGGTLYLYKEEEED